jgi:hypothetical protein
MNIILKPSHVCFIPAVPPLLRNMIVRRHFSKNGSRWQLFWHQCVLVILILARLCECCRIFQWIFVFSLLLVKVHNVFESYIRVASRYSCVYATILFSKNKIKYPQEVQTHTGTLIASRMCVRIAENWKFHIKLINGNAFLYGFIFRLM